MVSNKTPIIAVTRFGNSKLAKSATHSLFISASEPLFRSGAMLSRISQLNINDILYSGIVNSNYDECIKQFVLTHIEK